MSTADLLLHPVRLRVLQALLDGRTMTTGQLRDDLADVPSATLYRHVATLAEAGVLEVVTEQRVRGAVERTYRLQLARASVDADALAAMTPEDHARAFTAFVAGLLADFDRYLAGGHVDPLADQVSFRQVALWLTDEETAELLAEVRAAIAAHTDLGPGDGRRHRLLTTVLLPRSGGR
ncbi:MAG: helix-turn-helix domain-containing protein [Pseudonocardia sp.]|nr:helix-turn-helix domain-containing protein [Pseudonocardia sp.]